jgi:hypothetical protein
LDPDDHLLKALQANSVQHHAAQVLRRLLGELKRIEVLLVDAGLMPDE